MKYRNAQDIFPEDLLKQIQRYVSGETIYIPAGNGKRSWGETSGYQQFIRERNAAIKADFEAGQTIDDLMEKYCLSYDSIKRIVYSKKEVSMLKYSATLESAKAYAEAEKLDAWIHLYLNEEGRNIPFSDGLKKCDRYYFSPALVPLNLLKRCSGPEPEMKYRVDQGWWEHKLGELKKTIEATPDFVNKCAPMFVEYTGGEFVLNDGNHRLQAYKDLGYEKAWVLFWITEEDEYQDFMKKYGEYVKDCVVIRK